MILFAGGSDVFKVARETSETSHNLELSAVMNENTIELVRHAVRVDPHIIIKSGNNGNLLPFTGTIH